MKIRSLILLKELIRPALRVLLQLFSEKSSLQSLSGKTEFMELENTSRTTSLMIQKFNKIATDEIRPSLTALRSTRFCTSPAGRKKTALAWSWISRFPRTMSD